MTMQAQLEQLATDLERAGVNYALVGGLAVSARTEPRFTRDIDLAMSVAEDREAEHLVNALISEGYDVVQQVELEPVGRLASVRVAPPEPETYAAAVDIQFATSGIEEEIVAAAEPIDLAPGLQVPIARLPHLLALKLLSVDEITRPQDRIDIRALVSAATSEDLSQTRAVLDLIMARGFNRGRDLKATLDSYLSA